MICIGLFRRGPVKQGQSLLVPPLQMVPEVPGLLARKIADDNLNPDRHGLPILIHILTSEEVMFIDDRPSTKALRPQY